MFVKTLSKEQNSSCILELLCLENHANGLLNLLVVYKKSNVDKKRGLT